MGGCQFHLQSFFWISLGLVFWGFPIYFVLNSASSSDYKGLKAAIEDTKLPACGWADYQNQEYPKAAMLARSLQYFTAMKIVPNPSFILSPNRKTHILNVNINLNIHIVLAESLIAVNKSSLQKEEVYWLTVWQSTVHQGRESCVGAWVCCSHCVHSQEGERKESESSVPFFLYSVWDTRQWNGVTHKEWAFPPQLT